MEKLHNHFADLHLHTSEGRYTDGTLSARGIFARALGLTGSRTVLPTLEHVLNYYHEPKSLHKGAVMRLETVGITDHNTIEGAHRVRTELEHLGLQDVLNVIVGVERTMEVYDPMLRRERQYHVIGLFPGSVNTEEIDRVLALSPVPEKNEVQFIEGVNRLGGRIIIPHPRQPRVGGATDNDVRFISALANKRVGIEAFNGYETLCFGKSENVLDLAQELNLALVAGSDSHDSNETFTRVATAYKDYGLSAEENLNKSLDEKDGTVPVQILDQLTHRQRVRFLARTYAVMGVKKVWQKHLHIEGRDDEIDAFGKWMLEASGQIEKSSHFHEQTPSVQEVVKATGQIGGFVLQKAVEKGSKRLPVISQIS